MKRFVVLLGLLPFLATPAWSTWSIVAADTVTEEVAVVSATCVPGIDLKAFLPVVMVGRGAGAAQSFIDGSGQRRSIMRNGFLNGDSSSEILIELQALAPLDEHLQRVGLRRGGRFRGRGRFRRFAAATGQQNPKACRDR